MNEYFSFKLVLAHQSTPGDGFGAPGHIRFSYATSSEIIEKGIRRVKTALNKII